MKSIAKFMVIVMVALMSTSCVSKIADKIADKVEFKGVDNFDIKGTSAVSMDIRIDNQSRHKFGVEGGVVTLRRGDKVIATLLQKEKVTIPSRCESVTPMIWQMKIDAINLFTIGSALLSEKGRSQMKVDLSADVKSGVIKRKISRKNVSLSKFMTNFKH